MAYKEKDIMHENGNVWVLRENEAYTVMVSGITHSISDSSYHPNDDGLSLAKARCDYLARKGAASYCGRIYVN